MFCMLRLINAGHQTISYHVTSSIKHAQSRAENLSSKDNIWKFVDDILILLTQYFTSRVAYELRLVYITSKLDTVD